MSKFRLIAVHEDGTEVSIPLDEQIPSWLKRVRAANNLSMQELGAKLGVSKQAVYLWESGTSTPTMARILKLMELFATDNTPVEVTAESLLLPHASNVEVTKV